jgi:hypothetical protein
MVASAEEAKSDISFSFEGHVHCQVLDSCYCALVTADTMSLNVPGSESYSNIEVADDTAIASEDCADRNGSGSDRGTGSRLIAAVLQDREAHSQQEKFHLLLTSTMELWASWTHFFLTLVRKVSDRNFFT